MAEKQPPTFPLYDAWLKAQSELIEAQRPFWDQMAGAMTAGAGDAGAATAADIWENAGGQAREWASRFFKDGRFELKGEGIAQETLQKMLDPSQFLYAGSDEINRTIQKLVEGPEFADIGILERQALKATQEWLALREASAAYRIVVANAWTRAFQLFSKEMADNPALWKEGLRAVTNRWLEIANDELIATQRTDDFLEAQRKLLRAGVDYRIREREMVEVWCETHSIPTRTEVDDLHETVYRLRREMRDLKKQVDALKTPARKPARKKAARSGEG